MWEVVTTEGPHDGDKEYNVRLEHTLHFRNVALETEHHCCEVPSHYHSFPKPGSLFGFCLLLKSRWHGSTW